MPSAHTLYPNNDDVGTGNARGQVEGKEGGLCCGTRAACASAQPIPLLQPSGL